MKHNANVNYKGALNASSASLSSMNAIQAISVAGSSLSSGSIVFSTTDAATIGQNAGTITVSMPATAIGAYGWDYPAPIQLFNWSTLGIQVGASSLETDGNTYESGTINIAANLIPWPVQYNEVLMGVSFSTSNGTGSNTMRYQLGIYTVNGLTQFSRLSMYDFFVYYSQNSSTQVSYSWHWGTNSTSNSSSSGTAALAGYQTAALARLSTEVAGFIPPGQYWFAILGRETSTNSVVGRHNRYCISLISSNGGNMGDLCAGINCNSRLFSTDTNVARFQWEGSFTTTASGTNSVVLSMPVTFDVSILTNTTNALTGNGVFYNKSPLVVFRST